MIGRNIRQIFQILLISWSFGKTQIFALLGCGLSTWLWWNEVSVFRFISIIIYVTFKWDCDHRIYLFMCDMFTWFAETWEARLDPGRFQTSSIFACMISGEPFGLDTILDDRPETDVFLVDEILGFLVNPWISLESTDFNEIQTWTGKPGTERPLT